MNLLKRLSNLFDTSGKLEIQGILRVKHFVPDPNGTIVLDGTPCREIKKDRRKVKKCLTTAYCELLVDELKASVAGHSLFKYHDSGTGTVAEAVGDIGLGTPCGEARDVGTQEEGATAVIYKSVATHTYAGAFAITEHGLFNASSGVTLMDRSKFSAVNVGIGEKIAFDYQLSVVAGG
jgi:hypothetical protein